MKKMKREWKRMAAIALAVLMVSNTIDMSVFAATVSEVSCEHHTEHNADCGYSEGTAGSSCTHEHGEECYTKTEECVHTNHDESCGYSEAQEGSPCTHEHDEACGEEGAECTHMEHTSDCGYAEAQEGSPCVHECSEENGCITMTENCMHTEHDENCGYAEAVEGTPCNYVCESCADEDNEGQPENETKTCICTDRCTEDAVNEECEVCGVEGADLAVCEGTVSGNNEEQQENETAECTCGTDDDSIHATNCAVYVAPENPVCTCVEKCTEANVWCDVCGFDYTACTGTDEATAYEDTIISGECGAVTNDDGTTNVQWKLDTSTGTLTISGTGAMADYTFLSDYSIDTPWYSNIDSIQTVLIGDGIANIGNFAFWDCVKLTNITIPKGVSTIGIGAFGFCESLISINIPNSVTYIDSEAFVCCLALKSITIPNSVTSMGSRVFSGCADLESVTISNSINEISKMTFYSCGSLTSITIPESVTSIGEGAFWFCNALQSITIPDSVTSIGVKAFYSCKVLTSITIPDSVTSIGTEAFWGCHALTSITANCKWKSNIDSGNFYGLDTSQLETVTYTHPMKYSATGNELYGDCSDSCGELETITATLSVASDADLSYTGSAVKPALVMTYPDNWVGEKIQPTTDNCTYSNKTKAGEIVTCTFTYATGVEVSVDFTIEKATPTFSNAEIPTISGTYGEALSDMNLSTPSNNIAGVWNITETDADSIYPKVGGDTAYEITFTPTDTANYKVYTTDVVPEVEPKELTISVTATGRVYEPNNTTVDIAVTLDGIEGNDKVKLNDGKALQGTISSADVDTYASVTLPTLTLTDTDAENYKLSQSSGVVTLTSPVEVTKATHSVDAINKNYCYMYDYDVSIDLTAYLPESCGTVTYGTPTVSDDNSVALGSQPSVDENGKLTYTVEKLSAYDVDKTGTIEIEVSTANYEDFTITENVKQIEQYPVYLQAGSSVTLKNNTLTYGEALSKLTFNTAVFVDQDGNTVPGTLEWKEPTATPDAGTTSATWVFTPNDREYMTIEDTVAITVNKATPTVSAVPTVADRIYNPSVALQDSDLKNGTVSVPGTWSWQSATIPVVNNSGYVAVFTPTDSANYETVTRTITVTVTKATPVIASVSGTAITYGDTLGASTVSGTVQYSNLDTTAVAGSFAWTNDSVKPAVSDSNTTTYAVVFTPADTVNYNTVNTTAKLTVNKALNVPNMPGSTMNVSNKYTKIGDVPLPTGWEWQDTDKETALEVDTPETATAVYTGADKDNYVNVTVSITVTRNACDHVAGDVLYTGTGEKAPTCTEDGLGHRECKECGTVMESGIVVKALGHTGGTATCKDKAVCTRCHQPYGSTNTKNHSGGTEVRGAVPATPTTDGYTGDTYCLGCGAKISTGSVIPATGSGSGGNDNDDSDNSAPAPTQTPTTTTYIVQKGDTLLEIAGMFGCTVNDIVALNSGLIKNPDLIYPGWVLTIPVGGTTENTAPRADGTEIYVVQSGDTLYAIAKKYRCKVKDIVKLNGELIDDPDLIYPGWQLVIPQK